MLSVQTRIKIQTTVSQNYLLGEAHFVRKRIIWIFHMSFWGNEVTVRIKRSEMRLRLDSYVATMLLLWMTSGKQIWVFRNPNEVWISSCQNARYHHEVISPPQAISLLYIRRSPNTWGRGKLHFFALFWKWEIDKIIFYIRYFIINIKLSIAIVFILC